MAAMMAAAGTRLVVTVAAAGTAQQAASTAKKPAPIPAEEIDRLLAPVALYPDQLLAQILMCASDPAKVVELNAWMKKNATLKGTPLQDAAVKAGFEPSFVALVLFPDIVNMMAVQKDWTTRLGQAFAADRSAVFGSIQRLRAQAQKAGNLKDTPQQEVETKTTSAGEQVIVIEPSNPQVVYVPQYNPTTVYVQQSSSSADAAVAGIIGFTAGIAIGAAIDNDYYYGPYGWRGGGYMYNDAWDDYYDHREDAREDWTITARTSPRNGPIGARTRRSSAPTGSSRARKTVPTRRRPRRIRRARRRRSGSRPPPPRARRRRQRTSSGDYQSRGRSTSTATAAERSGTKSDAFSGYSSGSSTRAASTRGQSSRSSGGGGGRRR